MAKREMPTKEDFKEEEKKEEVKEVVKETKPKKITKVTKGC